MSTNDARNTPTTLPRPERFSGDIKVDQPPAIESREDLETDVIKAPEVLTREYAEALAFAEEPVTIRIASANAGSGVPTRFPAKHVDCWVNGRPAEIRVGTKWVPVGYLPVGVTFTTKRKYVEVLARSQHIGVNTRVEQYPDHEINAVDRTASSTVPFSVIRDDSPMAAEWLARVVSAR